MKERITGLLKTYFIIVAVFVVQKPLFMLYYHTLYADIAWSEWIKVMWHGLPLDFSLAGYLSVIPALLYVVSVWVLNEPLRRIWKGYFAVISVLISIIFVTDLALYGFWGFRLDATPLFYFLSSPKDSLASISTGFVIAGIAGMIVITWLAYMLFNLTLLQRKTFHSMKLPYRRLGASAVLLLITALLFIPIRGGFTVSTMNTGKVYFSTNQALNHAATNPMFNLMESLSKQADFAAQYRFMEAQEADKIFTQLIDPEVPFSVKPVSNDTIPTADTTVSLFNTPRPDILIVILESFSSKLMATLGGIPDVTPNLDSLARSSILFTNFYANSFRTDRGLISILSGYPAPPTYSVMKNPRKTRNLPSIASSLRKIGYATHYYYGGDADFTNMRSYLVSSGMENIVSDRDFPITQRLSKWGVHDHIVFHRLLDDLKTESTSFTPQTQKPTYRVLQTSSSHEPFEVPFHRLADKRLNAFAYTDSCVGDFIRQYKELPQWKNTIIILVPDHLGGYPEYIDNFQEYRYRIPLIITGGAISCPTRIDTYGSQQDIAATLLGQMGLPHNEFTFSKDMLDPKAPHFAFFTVPDAFGMATTDNCLIYDNLSGSIVLDTGKQKGSNLLPAKAYLQKLYDDLADR